MRKEKTVFSVTPSPHVTVTCEDILFFSAVLLPLSRLIYSERKKSLLHTRTSSKTHGMICLWRCPALRRICFLWRLRYIAIVQHNFTCFSKHAKTTGLSAAVQTYIFIFVLSCRMEVVSKVGGSWFTLPCREASRVLWMLGYTFASIS